MINGRTFYFNPHFAKTVETTDEIPANPTRIAIRTARQLYHLSLYYNDYAEITKSSTFNQETDIDYTIYDWTSFAGIQTVTVQSPLGVRDGNQIAFEATYNGGFHQKRGNSFVGFPARNGFFSGKAGGVEKGFLVSGRETSTGGAKLHVDFI